MTARIRLAGSGQDAVIEPAEVGEGHVLILDGAEQSHVDLADPSAIRHEYLRRVANVVDSLPAGPLRVLHLGAGALTLVRYVQALRPGSEQTVVELEAELVGWVLQHLPLPAGTRLTAVADDALAIVHQLEASSFDCVVVDIFTDSGPTDLGAPQFYTALLKLLTDRGVAIVNIGDSPGLQLFSRHAALMEGAAETAGMGGVWTLTDASMLAGNRPGNLMLAAGPGLSPAAGMDVSAEAQRWRAAGPHPSAVLDPDGTAELVQRFA